MKFSGEIEKLIGAKISDPEALNKEAKEKVKEYFESSDNGKWDLLSLTTRSKITKESFIKTLKKWNKIIKKIEILNVRIISGVSAQVAYTMFLSNGLRSSSKISLIKEEAPYKINADKPFSIVGITAPPYLVGS